MSETSSSRRLLIAGCLLTATGILLGAFGAHGLRAVLDEPALAWWQTGVQYLLWNAIGLVALSSAPLQRPGLPAVLIGLGTVVFAASLCLMALTGVRWLGAVTPIGGLLMIAGWLLAGWRAWRRG